MTTGIATRSAIDTAWVTRALTGAGFADVTVKDAWVTVHTEAGAILLHVFDRQGLLCLRRNIGVGKGPLPIVEGKRGAVLNVLQRNLDIARVTYFPGTAPRVQAEYDIPLLAGLSREQLVSMLRAFAADVAVTRRYEWDGE